MSLPFDCTLEIAADQVLAGQGIDPWSASPRLQPLRAAADRVLADCRGMLEPQVAAERRPIVAVHHGEVQFEGGEAIAVREVADWLRGATEAVFVVCTVGEAVSKRAAALMGQDPLAALALEGLACAGVDALASAVCHRERTRAERLGHHVTAPLSPGMCGWALDAGQRTIFGVVDAASIGVRLSDSWQMYPTKTASFVLGSGAGVVQDVGGSCSRCGARDGCAWRVGRGGQGGE